MTFKYKLAGIAGCGKALTDDRKHWW